MMSIICTVCSLKFFISVSPLLGIGNQCQSQGDEFANAQGCFVVVPLIRTGLNTGKKTSPLVTTFSVSLSSVPIPLDMN